MIKPHETKSKLLNNQLGYSQKLKININIYRTTVITDKLHVTHHFKYLLTLVNLSKCFQNVHTTRVSSTGSNKGLNSFPCYTAKMWDALPNSLKGV